MPLNLIDALTNATVQTEGLLPGQTPLRFGAKRYKNTIQGFPIDWKAWETAPKDRKNFYYTSPDNVPKVIRQQWKNYFIDPGMIGLNDNASVNDIIKKFDQTNPQSKIDNLNKKGINTNIKIKDARKKFDLSQLNPFNVQDAYAGETNQENNMGNPVVDALLGNNQQDLGTIDVIKNMINTGLSPSVSQNNIPVQPQNNSNVNIPSFSPPVQRQPQLDENGQTGFGRFLSQLGIPLATTAIGLASRSALPAAAGFQQGYTEEQKNRRDNNKFDTYYTYDETTNKFTPAAKLKGSGTSKIIKNSKDNQPSFGQNQRIQSIKSGLKRKEVTIGREFGEPTTYKITTIDDAYRAISDAGLDPAIFSEELRQYEPVDVISPQGKPTAVRTMDLEEALKNGYRKI